jgi:hypothetical protein
MPLLDVVGKTGAVAPVHMGAMAVKVGVMLLLTVTVSVAVEEHWPAVGVKV